MTIKYNSKVANGTYTALNFTISQYGSYMQVLDVLLQQGFDTPEAIKEAIDPEMLEAENKWREHFDMPKKGGVDWEEAYNQYLKDSSIPNPYSSKSGSRGAMPSGMRLTAKDLRKAVKKLRDNNVPVSDI